MKRLTQPSGEVAHNSDSSNDKEDSVVRTAILVHSNKNGKPMVFQSADGPIEFDEARIKNIIKQHNKMISKLAADYGGLEKMPIGAFPPILDQHEDDSTNRMAGRLNNLLRFEKRDVPGVGENCACAITDITFLGKDTVSRVKDGRIYHLSIGIDEATDTLGEVSTVINPAAPGAMLLKKQKETQDLREEKKMSKLSRMQAHAARLSKLKQIQESIKASQTKLITARNAVKLTARQGEVTHRLSALMSSKKLTPAEYKKLDIKKLSKLDDESLTTVLSAYEARENVIESGQRGSADAIEMGALAKSLEKKQLKRLKAEIFKDMKKLSGKDFNSKMEDEMDKDHGANHEMNLDDKLEEHKDSKELAEDPHAVDGQQGYMKMKAHLAKMGECLEKGDIEGAKMSHMEAVKEVEGMKHMGEEPDAEKHLGMGDVKSEDYQKNMGDVQSQVDELNTQMARLSGMVEELMSVEKEEGHELESDEEGSEEKKLSEEIKEDSDKEKV